ncbi:hypothetical protein [Rhizobium sp. C1]|uniref:hypothetical protein n=1 Tax=Rhizobium sp. C1 TaxID=1349799 RepID=UPI001E482D20|nr:hypothetical protein [Rhizobium sp. C1]MCD2176823.1 hypothetical protein [Rhizobium sp. C1]
MRVLVLVTAILGLITGPVFAGAREKRNAMHHIATVLAIAKLCPALESDNMAGALVLTMHGIRLGGPDGELVRADARQQIADLEKEDRDGVCASGILLYGPNGLNVPGMVREKK